MTGTASSAIVTGGASGLGRATVERLRAAGLMVTIADRDEEAGRTVAAGLGDGVFFEQTEITSDQSVAAAVRSSARRGPLRVAVNCVGYGRGTQLLSVDGTPAPLESFQELIEVNLVGAINSMRHEAAAMAALPADEAGQRGVIVNVSSIAGSDGPPSLLAYGAAKAGLAAMTLPAARQLGVHGIRVMTIEPGYFHTPPWMAASDAQRAAAVSGVPGPARLGQPEEFAELVQHIIENRYLNGTSIRLDAGARM